MWWVTSTHGFLVVIVSSQTSWISRFPCTLDHNQCLYSPGSKSDTYTSLSFYGYTRQRFSSVLLLVKPSPSGSDSSHNPYRLWVIRSHAVIPINSGVSQTKAKQAVMRCTINKSCHGPVPQQEPFTTLVCILQQTHIYINT